MMFIWIIIVVIIFILIFFYLNLKEFHKDNDITWECDPNFINTNDQELYKFCFELCKNLTNYNLNKNNKDIKFPSYVISYKNIYYKNQIICLILITDKYNILIFSGTTNNKLYYDNLLMTKLKIDNVKIHKGYSNIINNIKDKIIDNLNFDKEILITGYSLGGALATCLLYTLIKNKKANIYKCITFASPKVGDKSFKKFFKNYNKLINIICDRDIIPKITPPDYFHPGKKIIIKGDNKKNRRYNHYWTYKNYFLKQKF